MDPVSLGLDDELYRRLAPDTVDRSANTVRRSAFYTTGQPDPEASVYVKRLAASVDELLEQAGRPHFGMGLLRVSDVHALGLRVEHRPLEADPSHAIIVGANTRSAFDRLAAITKIVKWPAATEPLGTAES
jgi:hypothetical protein